MLRAHSPRPSVSESKEVPADKVDDIQDMVALRFAELLWRHYEWARQQRKNDTEIDGSRAEGANGNRSWNGWVA